MTEHPLSTCRIHQLTLQDFRNYSALRLQPAARLVALAGPNGAGKTNILEALSLLGPGAGLRGAELASMARIGSTTGWGVAAEIEGAQGAVRIGTSWQASPDSASRLAMADGKRLRSVAALAEHLRLLWLTPAQDRLFGGPAGDRRRFLDRAVLLIDPSHGSRVNVYDRLQRERLALLEQDRRDATWLATLETQIAETGIAIAHARLDAAALLDRQMRLDQGGAFPWGKIEITGEAEALAASQPSVAAEEAYRQRLFESRGPDHAAGRSLFGPHRSDIVVTHGPKAMAAGLCSTGEQKALLIGLILAQARAAAETAGVRPVLLLDEVTAHLDPPRRQALFGVLQSLGVQAFLTGTDREIFDGFGPAMVVYKVDNGALAES